jgi:RND superfamily putative drug exporter
VIEGLARTAGLITSAAAIMIAVFTAFTMGGFLVVQMLGFTLAVAVFIDATAVRMVVGPALLQLAGDWNWWPFGLYGIQQRLKRADAMTANTVDAPVTAQGPFQPPN